MLSFYQLCLLVIVTFVVLFPLDTDLGIEYIRIWTISRILNYYLMFRAWMMYRQLKADMAKLGVPMPAFKFVPIWERNGNN